MKIIAPSVAEIERPQMNRPSQYPREREVDGSNADHPKVECDIRFDVKQSPEPINWRDALHQIGIRQHVGLWIEQRGIPQLLVRWFSHYPSEAVLQKILIKSRITGVRLYAGEAGENRRMKRQDDREKKPRTRDQPRAAIGLFSGIARIVKRSHLKRYRHCRGECVTSPQRINDL